MPDAAWPTRIGYVAIVDDRGVMHDRLIHISVVNDGPIHANDGSIVGKVSAAPLTAGEADAHVSESIIDTAVVAHVRSPVASVKEVMPTFKAPIGRRPKVTRFGSGHPCARNPVIAVIVGVGPVTGSPKIAVLRAKWLLVHRHDRRCDPDADRYLSKRRCGNEAEQKR